MTDQLFSVRDQIVIVSGGSRGIGKAIANGFAERDSTVIVTGRDQETVRATATQIDHNRGKAKGLVCDVANGQN